MGGAGTGATTVSVLGGVLAASVRVGVMFHRQTALATGGALRIVLSSRRRCLSFLPPHGLHQILP